MTLKLLVCQANDFGNIAHLVSLTLVDVKPFNQLSRFQPTHLGKVYRSYQRLDSPVRRSVLTPVEASVPRRV